MGNGSEIVCDDCGKSFARQGQLKRHALTHSQERRYKCTDCGKSFLRQDALVRHEQLHQSSIGPNLLQRGGRACLNCAAAKARCSGELICTRCAQRSVECRYVEHVIPASPHRPSTMPPIEQIGGVAPEGLEQEQRISHDAVNQPSEDFETQYWNNDRLSNINWLATPMDASGAASGSFDNLPWLFDDSQLWGNLQDLPFGISPVPQLTTNLATRRASEAFPDTSTVSTESPAASSAPPPQEAGHFYVDGNESRLPRVKRRKLSSKSGPKTATPIEINFSLGTWIGHSFVDEPKEMYRISEQVYHSLRAAFVVTCSKTMTPSWMGYGGGQSTTPVLDQTSPSTVSSAAFVSDLPRKEVFDHLLTLYMEHAHPIIPLFQSNSLPSSWQLLLAMCALGSHFGGGNVDQFAVSMHEFLRRVLHMAAEDPSWLPSDVVEIAQVKLLHMIGLLYCGDERLLEHGLDLRLQVTQIEQVWKIGNQESHHWNNWRHIESARRTGYAMWLVDCMMGFHFYQKPLLQLEYADTILPCHEKVWAASDPGEWKECSQRYPSPPTLAEALQQLYIEKRLALDVGEFARVLLIHGIFHRTWEVEKYYQQPLSRWSPTAQKQSSDEINTKSPVWLPSIPTFAKWRNSACDCLDILHWSANAAIGTASGMEPPQVMHLHIARVVLLTPFKNIVSLARYLAGESPSHTSEKAARDRQVIRRWATQDQYKARLAMIHAGVMFWNVRRFSANGFYEPTSVALATLALWAFSAFSARPKSGAPSNGNGGGRGGRRGDDDIHGPSNQDLQDTDSSPEEDYDIILLDRPTDDELVQQFVRRGHFMKANMNGVGDLYGERGPERVLVEGGKLLATLGCWGVREGWRRVLEKLVEVTRVERRNAGAVAGES